MLITSCMENSFKHQMVKLYLIQKNNITAVNSIRFLDPQWSKHLHHVHHRQKILTLQPKDGIFYLNSRTKTIKKESFMFIILLGFSYFAADDNRELNMRTNQREKITAEAPAAGEAISGGGRRGRGNWREESGGNVRDY